MVGGIRRDAVGFPCFAFSAYFGVGLSLRAEVLALVTGLRLCLLRGFTNVNIQVDSLVLVGILHRPLQCPWVVRREVDQIWGMVADVTRVTHCYREANRVANRLANVRASVPNQNVSIYDQYVEYVDSKGRILKDQWMLKYIYALLIK